MDKKTYKDLFSNHTMENNLYFPIRRGHKGKHKGRDGAESIDSLLSRFLEWYNKTKSKSPDQLKQFTEGEFKNTYIGIRINKFYDMSSNDKI